FAGAIGAAHFAVRGDNETFSYVSAGFFMSAWMETAVRIIGLKPVWWSAAALPGLVFVFAAGLAIRRKNESAGKPLCDASFGLSALGVALAIVSAIDHPVQYSWIVTGTLLAYGIAYMAGAGVFRTAHWSALSSATFTLGFGYRLATIGLPEI